MCLPQNASFYPDMQLPVIKRRIITQSITIFAFFFIIFTGSSVGWLLQLHPWVLLADSGAAKVNCC
jgi:hypothetical protein